MCQLDIFWDWDDYGDNDEGKEEVGDYDIGGDAADDDVYDDGNLEVCSCTKLSPVTPACPKVPWSSPGIVTDIWSIIIKMEWWGLVVFSTVHGSEPLKIEDLGIPGVSETWGSRKDPEGWKLTKVQIPTDQNADILYSKIQR